MRKELKITIKVGKAEFKQSLKVKKEDLKIIGEDEEILKELEREVEGLVNASIERVYNPSKKLNTILAEALVNITLQSVKISKEIGSLIKEGGEI